MPKYAITRTWSLAGWVTMEVEAESEDAAREIEESGWRQAGAIASLPPRLRRHIEEIEEHVGQVTVLDS